MPHQTYFKQSVSLALLSCCILSPVTYANTIDMREYYVGEYDVDGFNTTEIEAYHAKVTLNINKGHFLRIKIQHDKDAGLGTYYGFLTEVDNNKLRLDYSNLGGQKFSAMCDVQNSFDNFPKIICQGNLQGTIGYDGVFVIHKVW